MGVFEFISGRKKPTPGEMAKQRLKVLKKAPKGKGGKKTKKKKR